MQKLRFLLTRVFYGSLLSVAPSVFKKIYYRKLHDANWDSIRRIKREPELLFLEPILKLQKDKLFVDVGANNGEYLFVAEKYIEPSLIFGFEPIPVLKERLLKLFRIKSISEYALSDTDGNAKFKIPYINYNNTIVKGFANATLLTEYNTPGELQGKSITIDVRTTTLDNFFASIQGTIGFLKIDVEGFESNVIAGSTKTILRDKPVLLIEIEQRFHPSGNIKEIFNNILTLGYNGYFFSYDKRGIISLEEFKPEMQSENNLGEWGYVNNFLFITTESNVNNVISVINKAILESTLYYD